jgi:hypothetical protein
MPKPNKPKPKKRPDKNPCFAWFSLCQIKKRPLREKSEIKWWLKGAKLRTESAPRKKEIAI